MNKHILIVLKWLLDKESVTEEELLANKESADADYADADAEAYADADYADAYTDVTDAYVDAAHAAYIAAAHAAYADADYVAIEKWLTEYFNITGEDRQEYFEALKEKG